MPCIHTVILYREVLIKGADLMGNLLRKKTFIISFVTFLLIVISTLYFSNKISLRTYKIAHSWAIDVKDPKQVYDNSDFIFIGTVEKQVGTITYGNFPETQFSVIVHQIIKGNIKDTIIVNQEGGIKNYTLTIAEGDKLLIPGEKYLLIGKFDKETNTYTLLPVYGDVLINNDLDIQKHVNTFIKFN